jgi:hypothetical protein
VIFFSRRGLLNSYSHRAFYRVVEQQKAGSQGDGGSGGGTSMMLVTGDENGEGRRWGVAVFRGEEGEEARRLHGAKDE